MHLFSEEKSNIEILSSFLSYIDEKAVHLTEVILNGDIVDKYKTVNHKRVLARLLNLRGRTIYCRGNNDEYSYLAQVDSYSFVDWSGRIWLCQHGHQYDFITYIHAKFYPIGKYIRAPIRFLNRFYNLLVRSSKLRLIKLKKPKRFEQEFVKTCLRQIKIKKRYDGIITGHTHVPKIVKEKNYYYVNCGYGKDLTCIIETLDGQINLCKFKKGQLIILERI